MKKVGILYFGLLFSVLLAAQTRETIYITGTVTNTNAFVDKEVIIPGKSELHIAASVKPLTNSIIKIEHEDAWVFFTNIRPQVIVDSVLPNVFINGVQAQNRKNARVAIYRHGAVLMPHGEDYQPLTIYTDRSYGGESRKLDIFNIHNDLKEFDNRTRSFKLKRGYMATLANNPDGTGFSRVFIADNADLEISTMTSFLDQTVSFIRVFNWEWVTKKGWCQTGWRSGGGEFSNSDKMNCTWLYTWSADHTTRPNQDYVLIKQQQYWPGWSTLTDKKWSSHLMSYNEPDHVEQSNVSVSTAISEWPNHLKTGHRLGSPATTDFNWLYQFMDGCKARNYRVDYVVVHAYWPAMSASQWYNALKAVYDRTGRPIWIKEWNNGANWTSESWPSSWNDQMNKQYNDIKAIVDMLDGAHFVERYSIYNWVEGKRAMILDDGWVTPAGRYYADNKSVMAFNRSNEVIPSYSFSSVGNSTLTLSPVTGSGGVNLSWTNATQEFASRVAIDRKVADGQFSEIYNSNQTSVQSYTDLSEFENTGRVEYRVRIILNNGNVIVSNVQTVDVTEGGDVHFGQLAYNKPDWNTIVFKNRYNTLPVAVFGSPTNNNLNVLFTNRANVSNTRVFTYQLWPWSYQNVSSFEKDETVPYFILRPGSYNWGGLKAQAYRTTAMLSWRTVTFPTPFEQVPVVLVTQSSSNNSFPTTIRVKNITATGFDVAIQRESAVTGTTAGEIFSYLAIEQGTGNINGHKIIAGRTADNAVGNALTQFARIIYGETIENPLVFAQLQTCNDDTVTATLRYRSVLSTEARVFKQREQSLGFTASANEAAGWLVVNPRPVVQSVLSGKDSGIALYPNPVTDRLWLGITPAMPMKIEFFNLFGVMISTVYSDGAGVDVTELPPGLYIVKSAQKTLGRIIKK